LFLANPFNAEMVSHPDEVRGRFRFELVDHMPPMRLDGSFGGSPA
jgi:hypothetical protein